MLDYNKPCNNISKKLQNVNKPHKHTFSDKVLLVVKNEKKLVTHWSHDY